MYRATDPETSTDAAEVVNISDYKQALLSGFRQAAKRDCQATALEAAVAANTLHGGTLNQETLRKRYLNLLAAHLIEPYGKRRCSVTGRTATTYRLVHRVPVLPRWLSLVVTGREAAAYRCQ
jgi:hypothetical protein